MMIRTYLCGFMFCIPTDGQSGLATRGSRWDLEKPRFIILTGFRETVTACHAERLSHAKGAKGSRKDKFVNAFTGDQGRAQKRKGVRIFHHCVWVLSSLSRQQRARWWTCSRGEPYHTRAPAHPDRVFMGRGMLRLQEDMNFNIYNML